MSKWSRITQEKTTLNERYPFGSSASFPLSIWYRFFVFICIYFPVAYWAASVCEYAISIAITVQSESECECECECHQSVLRSWPANQRDE